MKKTLILCLFFIPLHGIEERQTPPPFRGNFARKIVPSNTFAFGQNIFDKNTWVVYPTLTQCSGENSSDISLIPSFIYAPTDSFSIYTGLPIILKQKSDSETQRGIGDLFVSLEYAVINQSGDNYQNMVTIVGNIGLPTTRLSTTSDFIQTCTSNDDSVTNFFVGATASHISVRWYVYASTGATFNTKKNGTHPGNFFLYEAGVGINLGNPWNIDSMGLIEFNGIYTKKTSMCDVDDKNTGGNLIYIGPTFCFSGDRWLFSGGIQAAAVQQVNGDQDKARFRSAVQLIFIF